MRTLLCGGKPTAKDLAELDDFKAYMLVLGQAREAGIAECKAREYAATEVYGDKYAEGSRRKGDKVDSTSLD